MVDKIILRKALKRSWSLDNFPGWSPNDPSNGQGSLTSFLIYNIFGGEILKTHKEKGWHFYNRIEGERIDFTRSQMDKSSEDNHYEDIPSSPDETYDYFEQEEYSNFFIRFMRAFEEAVGLKYRPGINI
jgi:hypothetical protein